MGWLIYVPGRRGIAGAGAEDLEGGLLTTRQTLEQGPATKVAMSFDVAPKSDDDRAFLRAVLACQRRPLDRDDHNAKAADADGAATFPV